MLECAMPCSDTGIPSVGTKAQLLQRLAHLERLRPRYREGGRVGGFGRSGEHRVAVVLVWPLREVGRPHTRRRHHAPRRRACPSPMCW